MLIDEHLFPLLLLLVFCAGRTAETGGSGTGPPNQELTSENLIHPILKGRTEMKHIDLYIFGGSSSSTKLREGIWLLGLCCVHFFSASVSVCEAGARGHMN